jgi:hypothetical protein
VLTLLAQPLNGVWGDNLNEVFSTELKWLKQTEDVGELTILGQPILLPELTAVALVHLEQAAIDEVIAAFAEGTAAGREVHFDVRSGDRVRLFLGDRVADDQPLTITPWGIAGVTQQGLGADGQPLSKVTS